MENLDAFLSGYGYWVFFAVGFAEFVGVPIVSMPVLIGGGALVASGTLGFWGVWYPWDRKIRPDHQPDSVTCE